MIIIPIPSIELLSYCINAADVNRMPFNGVFILCAVKSFPHNTNIYRPIRIVSHSAHRHIELTSADKSIHLELLDNGPMKLVHTILLLHIEYHMTWCLCVDSMDSMDYMA